MTKAAKNSSIPNWQQELRSAYTKPDELLRYLKLRVHDISLYNQAADKFPLLVTHSYAKRIKKDDWNDPLLLQVLPHPEELTSSPKYSSDPVGDGNASVSPGLLHKYHGRALLIATGACAIHCRYCFRREFPYSDNSANRSQLTNIKTYLNNHPEITEVILSGGDPLTLSDSKFSHLFQSLSDIDQIQRIRIHTRLPIVLPSRINAALLTTLSSSNKKVVMVIHANHANELNDEVAGVLSELRKHQVTLLNQTVLLKGINDDIHSLEQLSLRLFDGHTLPYYLHVLDKVAGAMHFDKELANSYKLHELLQQRLPGYLVPKLVREESGQPNKTLLYHSS